MNTFKPLIGFSLVVMIALSSCGSKGVSGDISMNFLPEGIVTGEVMSFTKTENRIDIKVKTDQGNYLPFVLLAKKFPFKLETATRFASYREFSLEKSAYILQLFEGENLKYIIGSDITGDYLIPEYKTGIVYKGEGEKMIPYFSINGKETKFTAGKKFKAKVAGKLAVVYALNTRDAQLYDVSINKEAVVKKTDFFIEF